MKTQTSFPELSGAFGHLQTRHDLLNHSITIGFKEWMSWDVDTDQIQISETLIHFVEPDERIVGIKVFSEAIQ